MGMNAHWSVREVFTVCVFLLLYGLKQQGSEQPSGTLEGRTRRTSVHTVSPKSTGMTLTLCEPHFTQWPLQLVALYQKEQLPRNLSKWLVEALQTQNKNCDICFISQFVGFAPSKWALRFVSANTQSGGMLCSNTNCSKRAAQCLHYIFLREQNDQWCGNAADMISCLIYFQQPPLLTHPHTHAV